ncbi:hypothetical protein [Streptomyces sp. NPDC098781]|uniref:hypothetical protein n=1 Tax=Streptomyces sp. NPDC098781 TaxID=3366097 RepID=UPI00381BC72E
MHWIITATGVLAVSAGVMAGLAAIVAGWVPPWGRREVTRPTLWGYGTVVAAVGMAGFMFLGPLGTRPFAHMQLGTAGLAAFLAGTVMQVAAAAAPRVPR